MVKVMRAPELTNSKWFSVLETSWGNVEVIWMCRAWSHQEVTTPMLQLRPSLFKTAQYKQQLYKLLRRLLDSSCSDSDAARYWGN